MHKSSDFGEVFLWVGRLCIMMHETAHTIGSATMTHDSDFATMHARSRHSDKFFKVDRCQSLVCTINPSLLPSPAAFLSTLIPRRTSESSHLISQFHWSH